MLYNDNMFSLAALFCLSVKCYFMYALLDFLISDAIMTLYRMFKQYVPHVPALVYLTTYDARNLLFNYQQYVSPSAICECSSLRSGLDTERNKARNVQACNFNALKHCTCMNTLIQIAS